MYLVTFHSQFDANFFAKKMKASGEVRFKPVPRRLSSACGTCCIFIPGDEDFDTCKFLDLDFEAVYKVINKDEYEKLYEKD